MFFFAAVFRMDRRFGSVGKQTLRNKAGKQTKRAYNAGPQPARTRKRQGNVHTEKADDKGRNHKNQRNNGQSLHNDVQVVWDNRSERIHHPRKNVAVGVGHFDSLPVVYGDVFEPIFVFFVQIERAGFAYFFEQNLIAFKRSRKKNNRFLKVQNQNKFFFDIIKWGSALLL